jgi:general L-amino acid transport system substrate-binding protein
MGLALLVLCATSVCAGPRLDRIRRHGVVTCGVSPGVTGFAVRDNQGRYTGLDVDICRAVAAAIFGAPDKVTFVQASRVATFLRSPNIDLVSRRLTWELRREAPLGLLFGPIMFYDGQGFLVARTLGARGASQLSGVPMCVAVGTTFDLAAEAYFREHGLEIRKVPLASEDDFPAIGAALMSGRCAAYTADVSQLGAIRSQLARPDDFEILSEQISKEPLAQLVRQDDPQFFDILRWTVFALVEAEELGITSMNVDAMRTSGRTDVQRLLGILPGNGRALGLKEDWAYHVIRALGNYGELFERNVGRGSPIGLDRGLNRLWKDGGLLYAPPLR